MRRTLLLSGLALGLLISSPALAQSDADKATARQLGAEGQEALDRGDFRTAEDRYNRADKLFHAPTLLLGLARAQAKNSKYLAAQENYNRIIAEGSGGKAAFEKAVNDARREVDALAAKLGKLVINVKKNGADKVEVTLDEERVSDAALGLPRPVDPGHHVIKISAAGFKSRTEEVNIGEAGSKSIDVSLERETAASAAPIVPTATGPTGTASTQPTTPDSSANPSAPDTGSSGGKVNHVPAFIAWGIGGAGLVFGGITGVMALGKKSSLSDLCTAGKDACPPSADADINSYHTMATLSTVGFVVAGVGAAAGVVLWLTAPKESAHSTGFVQPYVGPGSVGAFGTF